MTSRLRTPPHAACACILSALLLALAVSLSACGGSSGAGGDGSADPATAVAPGAPLYAEVVVHPGGELAADFDTVAGKVLRTSDPSKKLQDLLDEAGKQNGFTYKEDIEPWLGDRIGAAITSFANPRKPEFVIAAATKDDGAARKAIEKDEKGDRVTTGSYQGVGYRFDRTDGTVTGVTDGLVLLTPTVAAFQRAVDATKGSSLAQATPMKVARAKLEQQRLAFAFANPKSLFNAIIDAAGPAGAQLAPLRSALLGDKLTAVAAAVGVDPDAIRIDAAALGARVGKRTLSSVPDTLAALPGDAWLGVGLGDVGGGLNKLLTSVGSLGAIAGADLPTILRQVKQQTGIDVRKDLIDWMGKGGLFVQGSSVADLGGALVVDTRDPAATRRGIRRIGAFLRRSGQDVKPVKVPGADLAIALRPIPAIEQLEVVLATGQDRFTAGVGRAAAAAGLKPSGTLAASASFKAGAAKLTGGVRPAFYLDFPTVVGLIESAAGDDASFKKAKPYLEAFTQIVAGAKTEPDATRAQLVIGVK